MASRSGGPAMAVTALMGAPLAMNAMAGPEPSAMSRLSEAMACCMRASPANAIDSISSPCLAKMPLRMPISSGTNENASGTALPTRSFSAAPAGGASSAASAIAIRPRAAARMNTIIANPSRSLPGQKIFGVQFAHVRLGRQRLHLDERAAERRKRLGRETSLVVEHRHQLVIDAAGGRRVGRHDLACDRDRLGLV